MQHAPDMNTIIEHVHLKICRPISLKYAKQLVFLLAFVGNVPFIIGGIIY